MCYALAFFGHYYASIGDAKQHNDIAKISCQRSKDEKKHNNNETHHAHQVASSSVPEGDLFKGSSDDHIAVTLVIHNALPSGNAPQRRNRFISQICLHHTFSIKTTLPISSQFYTLPFTVKSHDAWFTSLQCPFALSNEVHFDSMHPGKYNCNKFWLRLHCLRILHFKFLAVLIPLYSCVLIGSSDLRERSISMECRSYQPKTVNDGVCVCSRPGTYKMKAKSRNLFSHISV